MDHIVFAYTTPLQLHVKIDKLTSLLEMVNMGFCDVKPNLISPTSRPMIADLTIHFPISRNSSQYHQGTGTLIHPRVVLTVGHNVFDPRHRGEADRIEVRLGGQPPIVSTSYSTTVQWKKQDAFSSQRFLSGFDIGVIFLPQPSLIDATRLTPRPLSDQDLNQRGVWQGGFVGEPAKPFLEGFAHIRQVQKRRLYYPIQTTGGQSGGPLYTQSSEDSSKIWIVGVHASKIFPGSAVQACGSAVRITPDIIDLIEHWCALADG